MVGNNKTLSAEQLANQRARQQKKIEKDRRRKQYEDIQIQGTNDSSIVSKRSVEMLYTPKLAPELGEWFQHFVKVPKRRSPAINRGYWIRMESIRQLILRIIRLNPSEKICIVNLGCGYDPLPFQLLSQFKNTEPELLGRIKFVDIDYPDLVKNKFNMINESKELLDILQLPEVVEFSDADGIVLSTSNYHLVGCNLNDSELFNRQLTKISGGVSTTNIFIAEVSLAYMKPEGANPVIENASKYPNSHFIILEQLLPAGLNHPFAVKMMYHFDHLRSSLGCVQKYPLIKDQVARFKEYYETVEANDLYYNWNKLTSSELKKSVSSIETFDEWEEFIVFCQHYVIVHATNQKGGKIYEQEEELEVEELEVDENFTAFKRAATFERKFAAACYLSDKLLVSGGSGQGRENSTLELNDNFEVTETHLAGGGPSPRMCHTFTAVAPDCALLVGGRGKPGVSFSDVYMYNSKSNIWASAGTLDVPVSRHSTVNIGNNRVLIFGDCGFIIYNYREQTTTHLESSIDLKLSSCGFCYNLESNLGYIVGGMISEHIPEVNDHIYKFKLTGDKVILEEFGTSHWSLGRIGCEIAILEGKLIIAGGVNPRNILGTSSCIVTYDFKSEKIKSIPIDEMLIGFSLVEHNSEISCIGGGGVCYSFGSYYSGSVTISRKLDFSE